MGTAAGDTKAAEGSSSQAEAAEGYARAEVPASGEKKKQDMKKICE